MKLDLDRLSRLAVFRGLPRKDLADLLDYFAARGRTAAAGEIVVREGAPARRFGILLAGAVNIVRYSFGGREKILGHLTAGECFGTSFVLARAPVYFANIVAAEPTAYVLLDGDRVRAPRRACGATHAEILSRLLGILAARNIQLARKDECLTQRTTADKVMAYLRMQAEESGRRPGAPFEIPFTRQQLADYLNVDRAALSTEIGKLARRGLLETDGKIFRLR